MEVIYEMDPGENGWKLIMRWSRVTNVEASAYRFDGAGPGVVCFSDGSGMSHNKGICLRWGSEPICVISKLLSRTIMEGRI